MPRKPFDGSKDGKPFLKGKGKDPRINRKGAPPKTDETILPEDVPLTEKQRAFCSLFVIYRNATQAAIEAGYSVNTAAVIGCENLIKPNIKKEISRLQDNFVQHMAELGITRQKNARELARIAYTSIAHLHNTWIERKEFDQFTDEKKACIAEIDTKIEYKAYQVQEGIDKDGKHIVKDKGRRKVEYVKVKLFDKAKALDSLNKMMGWNEPDKIDHSNKDGSLKQIISVNFDKLFTKDESQSEPGVPGK